MGKEWYEESPQEFADGFSEEVHVHHAHIGTLPDDSIAGAFQKLSSSIETLQSINAHNMLITGGPQERYHDILEQAYAALGRIDTEVDALREELEHQHQRLDAARDAALARVRPENEQQN